jgi:hypothetical protein
MTPLERRHNRLRSFNSWVKNNDPRLAAEAAAQANSELNEAFAAASLPVALEREIELESIVLRSTRPVLAIKENVTQLAFVDAEDRETWKERIESALSFGTNVAIEAGPTSSAGFATFSPWRVAKAYICLTISRTWMAVAGAPRSFTLLHTARRSSGVISVNRRFFQTGKISRSKIAFRIDRVLSAMRASLNQRLPTAPKF